MYLCYTILLICMMTFPTSFKLQYYVPDPALSNWIPVHEDRLNAETNQPAHYADALKWVGEKGRGAADGAN